MTTKKASNSPTGKMLKPINEVAFVTDRMVSPLSLSALTSAIKDAAVPVRTVDIDISEFVPGAILTLSELDAPKLFQVPDDAKIVRRQNPSWPESLTLTVAMLSLAHVAPVEAGQTAGSLYTQIGRSNRKLLTLILKEYSSAFPESVAPAQSEDEDDAKND